MAVGYSADFIAHVMHGFMHNRGTRRERMHASLVEMGAPVLNGGLSTFIGIFALSFSKSGVFQVRRIVL